MKAIPWVLICILLGWILFMGDSSYKELSEKYKQERDQYSEQAIIQIKRADSLQSIGTALMKDVDSLKKISKQYDIKLIAIKKFYEKKYTDVSNNTPTESYQLFTEYTNRFPVPH